MKKYGKELLSILLIFTGCMLWSCGIGRYRDLNREYGGISLRFETNPLAMDSLAEIRRQQEEAGTDLKLTAWRQDYNIKIEDPKLGVCIESDVIYMWGDEKDILLPCPARGCVMSADKAYELWRSRDVLGKNVFIDGFPYKVTCVTDNMPGIIAVRRADYESGMKFTSLDIKPKTAGDQSDAQLEQIKLLNSHAADSSINYSDLLSVPGNFALLPALTVSAIMCKRILWLLYCAGKYKKGYRAMAFYGILLISWICICYFSGSFSLQIPENLIPTKWSDFDFWPRVIERYKTDLKGLRLMRVYALDTYFRKSFIYISACCLLGSACFISALRQIRNKSLNRLMAVEAATAFIIFFAAAASGTQYEMYGITYRLILPMYFVFDCLINNFNLSERA